MRSWGVAALAAVLVLGALVWVLPWFSRDRDIPAAVPAPRALTAIDTIALAPGQSACARGVAVDRRSGQARFTVATFGRPAGPPLTLAVAAGGYRAVARAPGGYTDNSEQSLAIAAPPRALLGRVCIRNDGDVRVGLAASSDRTRSRSVAVVAGRPTGKSFWLSFHERSPHTMLARFPETLRRMSTFRPGIVGPWMLWPLALLVVFGLPLGVLWA